MKKTSIIFLICFLITIIFVSGCTGNSNVEAVGDTQSSTLNENMVEGELLEQSSDQLFIRQEDGNEIKLNLTDETIYWEGIEWLKIFPISVGDHILAYGEWSKDNKSFNVDQFYNNRLILKGQVTFVSGEVEGYMLNQPGQEYLIFPLIQKTKLLTAKVEDPRSYKYFELLPNPGDWIEVDGRKITDEYVVAVRMTRLE